MQKYKPLDKAIKERYGTNKVEFTSATLNFRGIWSAPSAKDLISKSITKTSNTAYESPHQFLLEI